MMAAALTPSPVPGLPSVTATVWLDRLLLLINVPLYGGHDVEAMLQQCAAGCGADPADLRGVIAGAAGYFVDVCRRPPPPGLPTVRAFQRAQGDALVSWLAETC